MRVSGEGIFGESWWGRNKLARVEEEEIVMFSYRVNLAKKLQQIRD